MKPNLNFALCLLTIILSLMEHSRLQESQVASPGEPDTAALVGDHKISINKVKRHLAKMLGSEKFDEPIQKKLMGEALEHLIRRHAVLLKIQQTGISVGPGELRLELEKLRDRLKEVEMEMDDYLATGKISQSELEYEFIWRLSWSKYLKKSLTREQLTKYFQRHRRQFDGTEIHVAHLLFSSLKEDPHSISNQAEQVKRLVQEGKITWEAAVKKYSDAESSKDEGGEIGWVTFYGPMPNEFCQAAMKLNSGEISAPVQTVFGVHLIKCLEVRPGKLGPADAADEVREAAARFLFDSSADQQREKMKVEYKVDWPKPSS